MSTSVEQALKAGAKYRRAAIAQHRQPSIKLGDLAPFAAPLALVIGAALVFLAPDPMIERAYDRAVVNDQIKARRGEPIGQSSYSMIAANPFSRDDSYDVSLTIGNDYYRATSAATGGFSLRDGAIHLSGGETQVLSVQATGKPPVKDVPVLSFLPSILQSMANMTIAEGDAVNIDAVARTAIERFPIFYVPKADRALAEQGSVENVERTQRGFIVTYSDGFSIVDMLYLSVALAGLIGTVWRLAK